MPARRVAWTRAYGAAGWHLVLMFVSLALLAYVVTTLGLAALWDPDAWWQSIAVWFVGAVVLHDLLLFPAYALADRLLTRRAAPALDRVSRVPVTNYVRTPSMFAAFTFVLFFPGILRQGSDSFAAATGLSQAPFLQRWLLLVVAGYLVSGVLYALAAVRRRRG